MNSSRPTDNLPAAAAINEQRIHSENQNRLSSNYLGRGWSTFAEFASYIFSPLLGLIQLISDTVKSILSAKSAQTGIHLGGHEVKPIKLPSDRGNAQNSTQHSPIHISFDDIDLTSLEYVYGSGSSDGLSSDSPRSSLSRSSSNESFEKSASPISSEMEEEADPWRGHPLGKTSGSDSDHSDSGLHDAMEISRPSSTDRYVEIPGTGDCFYIAFAVGARRLFPENEEVKRLLKWDDSIDAILNPLFDNNHSLINLSGDSCIDRLKEPAAKLRNLTAVYIEQILSRLENDEEALTLIEKHYRSENPHLDIRFEDCDRNRQIRLASTIIWYLKEAISNHNDNINTVKIPYERKILQDNLHQYLMIGNEFLEGGITQIEVAEKQERMANLANTIHHLTQNISNWNAKKIVCQAEGFNRKEIKALRQYLNLMREKAFYSSYPEIEALSTLFRIPVTVNFQESHKQFEFNHHFSGKPILLDYDGQHFNLILS